MDSTPGKGFLVRDPLKGIALVRELVFVFVVDVDAVSIVEVAGAARPCTL